MEPLTTNTPIDDGIEIRVVKPEDFKIVWDFFSKYFFHHEPITSNTEPKNERLLDENFILSTIKQGTCLMAVLKDTDKLVAVTITGPQRWDETEDWLKTPITKKDTKRDKILKLLVRVEQEADVCNRYNVSKVFNIIATCVDVEMRGKGIGARLYNATKEMAKEMGFELLVAHCTSFYSARIKARLGWDFINVVYYKDYLDAENKQIFSPPPPHEGCKSYVLRL